MSGVSSKAAGKLENKKKYQQYEFNSYFDINLYESFYRSHDPQIGRFLQLDPKPSHDLSLYSAMENNPISKFDLLGDTTMPFPKVVLGVQGDGDQNGLIRNSTQEYRERHPVRAALKDFSHDMFSGFGINSLDNGIATISDPGASTSEKVKAGFSAAFGLLTGLPGKGQKATRSGKVEIVIDGNKHPESATHLQEAIDNNVVNTGFIDRKGKQKNHDQAVQGVNTMDGKDRDVAPAAVINTGSARSVKHIMPGDNRGAGGSIGQQIKNLPDGTRVVLLPINVPFKPK